MTSYYALCARKTKVSQSLQVFSFLSNTSDTHPKDLLTGIQFWGHIKPWNHLSIALRRQTENYVGKKSKKKKNWAKWHSRIPESCFWKVSVSQDHSINFATQKNLFLNGHPPQYHPGRPACFPEVSPSLAILQKN